MGCGLSKPGVCGFVCLPVDHVVHSYSNTSENQLTVADIQQQRSLQMQRLKSLNINPLSMYGLAGSRLLANVNQDSGSSNSNQLSTTSVTSSDMVLETPEIKTRPRSIDMQTQTVRKDTPTLVAKISSQTAGRQASPTGPVLMKNTSSQAIIRESSPESLRDTATNTMWTIQDTAEQKPVNASKQNVSAVSKEKVFDVLKRASSTVSNWKKENAPMKTVSFPARYRISSQPSFVEPTSTVSDMHYKIVKSNIRRQYPLIKVNSTSMAQPVATPKLPTGDCVFLPPAYPALDDKKDYIREASTQTSAVALCAGKTADSVVAGPLRSEIDENFRKANLYKCQVLGSDETSESCALVKKEKDSLSAACNNLTPELHRQFKSLERCALLKNSEANFQTADGSSEKEAVLPASIRAHSQINQVEDEALKLEAVKTSQSPRKSAEVFVGVRQKSAVLYEVGTLICKDDPTSALQVTDDIAELTNRSVESTQHSSQANPAQVFDVEKSSVMCIGIRKLQQELELAVNMASAISSMALMSKEVTLCYPVLSRAPEYEELESDPEFYLVYEGIRENKGTQDACDSLSSGSNVIQVMEACHPADKPILEADDNPADKPVDNIANKSIPIAKRMFGMPDGPPSE